MFNESKLEVEKHKKTYEKSDKAISLERLMYISTTPESKELLNILIDFCKEYYESIHTLQTYITENMSDPEYDEKVNELALEQSKVHDVVMEKFKDFAENINDEKIKNIMNDRMAIGEFAAIVGEMQS